MNQYTRSWFSRVSNSAFSLSADSIFPIAQMNQPPKTDQKHALRGTEVFVGGLSRTISEEKIHQEFSVCGEILEIRMIKDQKGILKGFCFVRFSTKEAADRAIKEKSGTLLDGKNIGVLPSIEQDTLYFGNLNKAWNSDEFEKIVLQVFPDVVSIDLPMLEDMESGHKQRNRGFAFVKFSSHAAAARAQRVGSQRDFRLGNLHPAVQWAEEDPVIDPRELSKIKIAFIRNLPISADENFLRLTFEPFGKVEKVVISKKGSFSVGFVHFSERSDLDRAIKELNEKTIQGNRGGSAVKLLVEVARPMDKSKKRAREDSESNMIDGHSKHLKGERDVPSSYSNPRFHNELPSPDPYENAVMALPLTVKERLLRILRLGIATRFDIDVKTLCNLKDLPESTAISVLDQFMLTGASTQHKGSYLNGLVSKHLFDRTGLKPSLISLSKYGDSNSKQSSLFSSSHRVSPPASSAFPSLAHSTAARPGIYASHYSSSLYNYPLSGGAATGRLEENGSDFTLPSRAVISGSQNIPIPIPRMTSLEERRHVPYDASLVAPIPYGGVGLRTEERHHSPLPLAAPSSSSAHTRRLGLSPDIPKSSRPQVRFDPFTGEPYKFDPFTGEPILPDGSTSQF